MRYSVFAVNPQNFISFGSFVPSGKFLLLFLDNLKSKVELSCLMILKASYHVEKQKTLTQRLIIREQKILRGQTENVMSIKMIVNLMRVVSNYYCLFSIIILILDLFLWTFFVFARSACTLKEKEQIVLKYGILQLLFRLSKKNPQ